MLDLQEAKRPAREVQQMREAGNYQSLVDDGMSRGNLVKET